MTEIIKHRIRLSYAVFVNPTVHLRVKKYPSAKVTALDYFALSVEKTKDSIKDMIESGRCKGVQGNVAQLPLADGEFELAAAFETVYFLPMRMHSLMMPVSFYPIIW